MRSFMYSLVLFSLAVADEGFAQNATPKDEQRSEQEIVVEGRKYPDEHDVTNSKPKVFTGSRLKRQSLQRSPNIASATTLGGLTPDSGVDAFKNTITRRWKSCKVTGANVSKVTACALIGVQKAFDEGNYRQAQSLARAAAQSPQLPIEDRFVLQSYLYRIAEAIPDRNAKRRALTELVDTGLLSPDDELSAVRTLAAMVFRDGDKIFALELYERVGQLDPEDAQVRINAAALLQSVGRHNEARLQVREAVGIAQRNGKEVPRSWLENSR